MQDLQPFDPVLRVRMEIIVLYLLYAALDNITWHTIAHSLKVHYAGPCWWKSQMSVRYSKSAGKVGRKMHIPAWYLCLTTS